jgi:glycerol-3-phosphate dehydrogenase
MKVPNARPNMLRNGYLHTPPIMRVAVVGGGINGIMTAWQARLAGHDVDLYERGSLMSADRS